MLYLKKQIMANQQATRVLETSFLILSFICLGIFAYQVFFLPEVSKTGYMFGAIGFLIRVVSRFRTYFNKATNKSPSQDSE